VTVTQSEKRRARLMLRPLDFTPNCSQIVNAASGVAYIKSSAYCHLLNWTKLDWPQVQTLGELYFDTFVSP